MEAIKNMTKKLSNAPLLDLTVLVEWTLHDGSLPDAAALQRAFREQLRQVFEYEIERHSADPESDAPLLTFHLVGSNEQVAVTLGRGVLSVSTSQPYESWEEFRPLVEDAIRRLFLAIDEDGGLLISSARILYTDAFGPEYWSETQRELFLTNILGIRITFPKGAAILAPAESNETTLFRFSKELGGSRSLQVGGGLATVSGSDHVVLEIGVSFDHEQSPATSTESVLSDLDGSQVIAHQVFEEITLPVRAIMEREDAE